MQQHPTLDKNHVSRAVLRRTRKGQETALAYSGALTREQARLLLMVNGYTPLDALPGTQLLQLEREAAELLEQGLVEPVEPKS